MKRSAKITLTIAAMTITGMLIYTRYQPEQAAPSLPETTMVMQETPLSSPAAPQYQLGDTLSVPSQESSEYHASSDIVNGYKETAWEALVPASWDPMAPLKALNVDELDDSDPRAMEALDKAMKYWGDAPVNDDINQQAIRIPGFVVVLESNHQASNEFLLVPYFGACIHTPPPPANQIIHVKTSKPIAHLKSMDTVWVHGKIAIEHSDTSMGKSGYTMQAAEVMPYEY